MSKVIEAAAKALAEFDGWFWERMDNESAHRYRVGVSKVLDDTLPHLTEGLAEEFEERLDGDCGYGIGEYLAEIVKEHIEMSLKS